MHAIIRRVRSQKGRGPGNQHRKQKKKSNTHEAIVRLFLTKTIFAINGNFLNKPIIYTYYINREHMKKRTLTYTQNNAK